MYIKFVKRFFDITLSMLGIIVLFPLFVIITIAILIDDFGPVFFKQDRIGINKSHFNILKFRTMKVNTPHDIPTHLLKNPEQYITKIGRFLRKTSLDELPQLFNILRGDMTIIGPRPALWNQVDLIEERDKYNANSVKPGLAGWAQINGRDELEIEEKARLDGEYVEKQSLLFDCRCFFCTIICAINRKGFIEGGTGALKKEEEKVD